MRDFLFYDRRFLNTNEGTAAMELRVGTVDTDYVNASATFTDCSNNVSLDFDFHDETSYALRLRKIDRLIEGLTAMRAAMVLAEKRRKARCK